MYILRKKKYQIQKNQFEPRKKKKSFKISTNQLKCDRQTTSVDCLILMVISGYIEELNYTIPELIEIAIMLEKVYSGLGGKISVQLKRLFTIEGVHF